MLTDQDFSDAGLFDPALDTGTGRLELLRWLESRSVTLDQMIEAHNANGLGALLGDQRLRSSPTLQLASAIELSGLSEEVFVTFANALGLPSGEGSMVSNDETQAIAGFSVLSSMFTTDEALGLMRVVGSSMNRISEAAVSLFLIDVESPHLAGAGDELELAQKVHEAIGLIDDFANHLEPLLRRHIMDAIDRTRITTLGPHERHEYRYAVGFVDLVGFTSISGGMDSRTLVDFLRDFEARAHAAVSEAGGKIVKLIGDEVMFVATSADAACRAGRSLMRGFGADERILPRGGIAMGHVIMRAGDYFGPVVNLASRLVDEAVPQELLVTEAVAESASDVAFEPAGRRMVKGFSDPIRVFSLT